MNNQQDEDSVDYFKDKLFQSFKETGMLDSVKAQLRHKMVEKLVKSQRVQSIQQKHLDEQGVFKQLTHRLMASIVSEYLEKQEFGYSSSIFLPESGYANKNLARFEILEVMNAKSLDNPKQSILESMVEMYLNNVKNVPKQNCSTQTEHADAIFNLEQRLNSVDNRFRERLSEINTPSHEIEERLMRFKKDYEARVKAETNAEIVRIREFEISTVRMEEQEKHRKHMAEYREEIEKNYMDKLNKLREREKDTIEKCGQKMKEIETANHQNRQRILKDFELLRMREEEVDKQRQLNDETLKISKQKVDNYEQELKEKIKKAEEAQLIVEKKYQNDLAYTKLEAHRDLETEKLEILEKRRALDEDIFKINQMKDTVGQFTDQNKRLVEDNRRQQDELTEVKKKKKEIELELAQIRDNLRTVSDSYRRDQDMSRNQEQRLKVKDEEITFLKDALEESKKLSDQHKQTQVDNMKKFNGEIAIYQQKIEENELKIKELRRNIADTEFQLEQARRHIVVGSANRTQMEQSQSQQQQSISQTLGGNGYYGGGGVGGTQFKISFQKELDELKEKRRLELISLQRESEFQEKRNYNYKFDSIWDIANSSVDFSQIKLKSKDNKEQQDRQGNNERAEITRSHIYGDLGMERRQFGESSAGNLIEESFHEDNNNNEVPFRVRHVSSIDPVQNDKKEMQFTSKNNQPEPPLVAVTPQQLTDKFPGDQKKKSLVPLGGTTETGKKHGNLSSLPQKKQQQTDWLQDEQLGYDEPKDKGKKGEDKLPSVFGQQKDTFSKKEDPFSSKKSTDQYSFGLPQKTKELGFAESKPIQTTKQQTSVGNQKQKEEEQKQEQEEYEEDFDVIEEEDMAQWN